MGIEKEHKYLVRSDEYKAAAHSRYSIRQGYLSRNPDSVVRVRTRDDKGFLTVKGRNTGDTRQEFEYEIPLADAEQMLALCQGTIIDKTRFIISYKGHIWEVDEFHGLHKGLVIAEIELAADNEGYTLPPWVGENVTGNPAYYNSNM